MRFNSGDAGTVPCSCVDLRKRDKSQADIAKVLTFDEALRIAVNVAKLPGVLGTTS